MGKVMIGVLQRLAVCLLAVAPWPVVGLGTAAGTASAQETLFFRIGTGSISGIYFPVGGLLASAISSPPGANLCGEGGSCGVPGLVAVAQASNGSIANVRDIASGHVESALVQADVAHDAIGGVGAFASSPVKSLRAIASLYSEGLHIVVRADRAIGTVRDLAGKRVSLDLKASGTRAVAEVVLAGYDLSPRDLVQVNSQVGPAIDRLREGKIDAFFFVGGYPTPALQRLARSVPIRLLPVDAQAAARIRKMDPFLAPAQIPAGTYEIDGAVDTLSVSALWLVSESLDADLVYGITAALWHPQTRRILDQGPPATSQIRLENALRGIAVPLHEGAERFYREMGLIQPEGGPAPSRTSPVLEEDTR